MVVYKSLETATATIIVKTANSTFELRSEFDPKDSKSFDDAISVLSLWIKNGLGILGPKDKLLITEIDGTTHWSNEEVK